MDIIPKTIFSTRRIIYTTITVAALLLFHLACVRETEETSESKVQKSELTKPYSSFSRKGLERAWSNNLSVAKKIYNKELSKGETNKEFKGSTIVKYRFKAITDKRFAAADRWILFTPCLAIILLIVAIVCSLEYRLGHLTRLDAANNDATKFNSNI